MGEFYKYVASIQCRLVSSMVCQSSEAYSVSNFQKFFYSFCTLSVLFLQRTETPADSLVPVWMGNGHGLHKTTLCD